LIIAGVIEDNRSIWACFACVAHREKINVLKNKLEGLGRFTSEGK
jgi:hypothetical protein